MAKIFKTDNYFFSLLIIFILTMTILVLSLSVYKQKDVVNDKNFLEQNQAALVKIGRDLTINELEQIVTDIKYLNTSPLFLEYINNGMDKNSVENEWEAFSDSKMKYDQLRYLDDQGNELMRINYNNGNPERVTEELLQNKKDRYYFTETIKLGPGEIYMSKFDLNIEGNSVEQPEKPMIRFGLPVFDKDNVKTGVFVANYLGEKIKQKFLNLTDGTAGSLQLINKDSYWLIGPDKAKEWGFMYPERENYTFKNLFPSEWERISKEKKGHFYTKNGSFTFDTINPKEELRKRLKKEDDTSSGINASDMQWIVMCHTSDKMFYFANDENTLVLSITNTLRSPMILTGLILASLVFSIVSVLYISGNKKIKIMATYDPMTGSLNRATGIQMIEDLMRQKNDIVICFTDINGLKEINDILGHEQGDDLILTSVKIIKENIREKDLLIRLGGDEFLICFVNIGIDQVETTWLRILDKIKLANEGDKPYIISLSHGIAEIKKSERTMLDEMIKEADIKMYDEKRSIKSPDFSVIKKK
ncbi:MAG: diguanylate cyclase [Synergistaceae bacterium]|nr:diguanylate cyclase [Synergistaceae bacterium]MDD3673342.1 diguanylate cyclase [Synergistaceae bacterium]